MINKATNKKISKEEIDNYIFGMFYGFSIVLIFMFRFLYKKLNFLSIVDLLFVLYGIFCIMLATINPNYKILDKIRKLNMVIFNFLGEMVLRVILTIIYILLVIPVGLFAQKRINSNLKTNFVDYNISYNQDLGKYKFLKVFKLFSNDYFYMIPLIIILLIISVLVIFITSSVFTPLIYTLF